MGDVTFELYVDHAPKVGPIPLTTQARRGIKVERRAHHLPPLGSLLLFVPFQTCKNFVELAKRGYYNGTVMHRIIAVSFFVLQPFTEARPDLPSLRPGLHVGRVLPSVSLDSL